MVGMMIDTACPPQRIQRHRATGWRMPERAVYIGRPSPWGNPFPVDGEWITWMAVALGYRGDLAGRRAAAVGLHRAWMTRTSIVLDLDDGGGAQVTYSTGVTAGVDPLVQLQSLTFARHLGGLPALPVRPDLAPLRGRDLVCWCAEGEPCHADVLLELANDTTTSPTPSWEAT